LPLYEYQCAVDGTFEQMQKFSDPPLTACPKCGGPVEKLLSAPAIQFKGSGWYITDYARKSTGEGTRDKPAASESTGTGTGETKSGSAAPTAPSTSGGSSEKK
jgi:putative FmdB family regulatory protein